MSSGTQAFQEDDARKQGIPPGRHARLVFPTWRCRWWLPISLGKAFWPLTDEPESVPKNNHFVVQNIQNLGTQCQTKWSEKFPGDWCEKFHQTSLCRDYWLISPLTRDTDWEKKSEQQTLTINQQICSQKRIARSYKMGGREVNHSDMSSHCSKNWYTDKKVKRTSLGISFPMEKGQVEKWYFHFGARKGVSVIGVESNSFLLCCGYFSPLVQWECNSYNLTQSLTVGRMSIVWLLLDNKPTNKDKRVFPSGKFRGDVSVSIFEHKELPAKLLNYFLRCNKSNINQNKCVYGAFGSVLLPTWFVTV